MSTDQLEPATPLASSIADLLEECSAGDLREAVSVAYRDHGAAVYRVARHTGGAGSAEDVTHEVFLRLWKHPEKFDAARGSLRTFLLSNGHSIAIDAVRSESSRRAREQRSRSAVGAPYAEVDHDLLRNERATLVAEALNELPLGERQAIVTAFYGQCTYREAATLLGEPEGTIKSRIRFGLRRLRTAQARLTAVMSDD